MTESLWCMLPRDARTLIFCQPMSCPMKPLKVKLLAGERKATEIPLISASVFFWRAPSLKFKARRKQPHPFFECYLPCPFFPGILLSRPPQTQGNGRFSKRTMVGRHGESTSRILGIPSISKTTYMLLWLAARRHVRISHRPVFAGLHVARNTVLLCPVYTWQASGFWRKSLSQNAAHPIHEVLVFA